MNLIIFSFFATILLLTPYQSFAQQDEFEIIGETLTHDPTICALEPDTTIQDAWKKLSKYTRGAVLDWENQLHQQTRTNDTWNMKLQLIPLERQTSEIECDITIEFLPKPQYKEDEFQVAGYTINNKPNDADIVVYFLNVELERTDYTEPAAESGYYYSIVEWIPSYADYLSPAEPLKMAIKHEIGHALGLEHYISYDEDRIQKWEDGVQRPPSIMIPIKPTKVISADITPLDVEKLVGIYGTDGFYSEEKIDELYESLIGWERIVLPDWIKNNVGWWADGIISDKDFASGIEFMIENGMIEVGGAETNSFSVEQKIPDWVKSNAKWWSEGMISSEEFVKGLQFLVQAGIIRV